MTATTMIADSLYPSTSDSVQQGDGAEIRSPTQPHPEVTWASQKKGSEHAEAPYTVLREEALEERKLAQPGETPLTMKHLYDFWSHFLIGKFNAKMYEEFRTCAIEDASKPVPSKDGLKCLIRYYKRLFARDSPTTLWVGDRPIPEIFSLHYQGALLLDPHMGTNGDAGI